MSFDLTNVGSTLETSGGPGTSVMGGRYWDQDGTDDVLWAADPADLNAIADAVSIVWWVRAGDQGPGYNNHWAKGNSGGIQARQRGTDANDARWDVNDTSGGGEVVIDDTGDPIPTGTWVLCAMTWDGTTVRGYVSTAGTVSEFDSSSSGGSGDVVWSTADYTVGAQDPESGTYEDFREQDVVPPIWFDTVLALSDLQDIVDAKDGSYESTVSALNPIHFVNEADGLTDTTGVGGEPFAPDGITLATTTDAATGTQPGTFDPDGTTAATTTDPATYTATGTFTPDIPAVATTTDQATYTATGTFTPDGTAAATTVDPGTFTAPGFAPDPLALATDVDVATYTVGPFTPDGLDVGTTVDDATFTSPASVFAPDGLTLASSIDAATYTATGTFTPDVATAGTEVDAATFTSPASVFSPDPLTVDTTVDPGTYTAGGTFGPAGLDLTTTLDAATFVDPAAPSVDLAVTVAPTRVGTATPATTRTGTATAAATRAGSVDVDDATRQAVAVGDTRQDRSN